MSKSKAMLSLFCIFLLLMAGCSGDSGSSSTPTTVSGVAAAGAPIEGMVFLKGAAGNTVSGYIGLNGNYSFTAAELASITVPYIIYAEGIASGETMKIYSAGFNLGNLNITPITDFIVRTALGGDPDTAYASWSAASLTSSGLRDAETKIQTQFQPVLNAAGAASDVNLLTITFAADGTGLDTILDIIDISFTGNVATVTNNITGSTYTDDVSTTSDDASAGLPASDETGTAGVFTDAGSVYTTMQVLVDLYATEKPSAAVIDAEWAPHMADEFVGFGQTKTDMLAAWATGNEGPPVGFSLIMSLLSEMTASERGSYQKGYWTRYFYAAPYESGNFLSSVVYDGTNWFWYGSQRWVDIHIEAYAESNEQSRVTTLSTGLNLDIRDPSGIAAGNGVNSAIITGAGLPAAGVILERNGIEFRIPGGYGGGSYEMTNDTLIGSISDNEVYTIKLYVEAASVVDSTTDTPLATYTEILTKRPLLNSELSASMFPTLMAPTSFTFSDSNYPGVLTVSWTNTTVASVRSITLSWQVSSVNDYVENRSILPTDTSATIDTSAKTATPDNNAVYLWVTAQDVNGRRYGFGREFRD